MARLAVIPHGLRRLLLVSLPVTVLSAGLLAVLVEAWVRVSWDPRKGTPGFFVSDPVRGQRLAANYDGWFAGVPIRTNALGFRATRDFDLAKQPTTFRILVLGDSVTFGHGAVHDYPSLLETLLTQWRPDVDWQVWNLGVPGYNTAQELAYLREVGPSFQPDLVVVGFFINDIIDNTPAPTPGPLRTAATRGLGVLQRYWYSTELYKRVALTIAWRWSGEPSWRRRFEAMENEERVTANMPSVAESSRQAIIPFSRLSDEQVAGLHCAGGMRPNPADLADMQARPDWPAFVEAVRALQALHRAGTYRLVFFLNLVPPVCPDGDFFYDGKSLEHEFFRSLFSDGVPTISAYPAFLHTRPSEMPLAEAHAIGNANQLKAEALFAFLHDQAITAGVPTPAAP